MYHPTLTFTQGVYFIHQKLGSHGYLKTSNVLVSKHFTMKVADFGEHVFSSDMNRIHGLPELERNQSKHISDRLQSSHLMLMNHSIFTSLDVD